MMLYNSATPKRTVCWSSSTAVRRLDKGPVKKTHLKERTTVKTVNATYDAHGNRRFTGNSNLRKTQLLFHNVESFESLFDDVRKAAYVVL